MNSDCTCDYRSQSCRAYCQLLQPAALPSELDCYHRSPRLPREGDPLRELNVCEHDYDCIPRSTRLPPVSPSSSSKKIHHRSLPIPNQRPFNAQYCNLRDDEWNSAHLIRHRDRGDYRSNDSLHYEKRDKYSAKMREQYIEDMEILKERFNLLKNGVVLDNKRLRRRSESEPGYPSSSERLNKRARDLSPPSRMLTRQSGGSYLPPFRRETRSVPPKMTFASIRKQLEPSRSKQQSNVEEDSAEEDCGRGLLSDDDGDLSLCEEGHYDPGEDEDDDCSVASEVTSGSNDSVGRCLGSISLTEKAADSVTTNSMAAMGGGDAGIISLFRPSLFSFVPPYVRFSMHDVKGPPLPPEISKLLKWKLSTITPVVVRKTLTNSGFKLVRKSNEWTGQWGKHMNSFLFKTLQDFQKLNHFPGTFQIGRKDRLWKNLNRLILKFGKREFGFIPTTYILPQDNKSLLLAWEKTCGKGQWIVKPPAAARGTGIRVVHRWSDIPKNKPVIVQKYIRQPYLINGSKFDLRLYVLVTGIHPLRIYMYDDGLVRFASVKYSENMESLGDRFMHLTNYSINRLSNHYLANEDAGSCSGHKWTLKTLWSYLENKGVKVKALKRSLTDLVIKTIISGESYIQVLSKNNLPSRYCSYELFGIDVLLDSNLRPWLLEVNISPSLHSASPLDLAVKGPLVRELFNVAGFQIPAKLSAEDAASFLESCGMTGLSSNLCYDKRLYTTTLSRDERIKHSIHNRQSRNEYLDSILGNITSDDLRHLIQYEDELTQIKRLEKIFPTPNTHAYHQYFESARYYNYLFDAWESKYFNNRQAGVQLLESMCSHSLHLQVPFPGSKTKFSANLNVQGTPVSKEEESKEEIPESEARPSSRNGKRRKTGVLAKPHLRAAIASRRTKNRCSPIPETDLIPWLPMPTTCKLASASVATQLPPLNIRTSS